MMPQPHQLIQKVTGFTGSNIFEQSFVIYHFSKTGQQGSFISSDNVPALAQILSFPQQFIIGFPFFRYHAASKSGHLIRHTIDHFCNLCQVICISFENIC